MEFIDEPRREGAEAASVARRYAIVSPVVSMIISPAVVIKARSFFKNRYRVSFILKL